MSDHSRELPVLAWLRRFIAGKLSPGETTHMRYPTAISRTLAMRIVEIDAGRATLEIDADAGIHGNQQGTVHGGLLCELADAAIGTAHSTQLAEGESFASIDLKVNFIRPVWKSVLRAVAKPMQSGNTVSHYTCEIFRDDGKLVAMATSSIMTLRGEKAAGR
ncbi:MAG: thioesterase [Hydrogenophilales bacterium RIFOXYD1_FULL_62_11]|nr:MAG: thioesterase [Hydrogenophilales bacterium RIFOXYD1_FULL_62_11]